MHLTNTHPKKWTRFLVRPLLGLAITATLAVSVPRVNAAPAPLTASLASATGCTHSVNFAVGSCVGVMGSGTWVSTVDGGLVLAARGNATGYWNIVGSGINIKTPIRTHWNQSYWHNASYNSGWFQVNRFLPKGSRVCSTFWKLSGGIVHSQGTACETIQ